MKMPDFTNENDAKMFLINFFEDFLKRLEEAKNFEEKVKIFRDFNMSDFDAEGRILNGKPVKDYQEYQNAKSLILDFFNWLEKNKNFNVFSVSTSDNFYNNMHGDKTLMVAKLIQLLPSLPIDLQTYFILNIYRTTYELNFKNMSLLINELRRKQNKNTVDYYNLENLKNEFQDYPQINSLLNYFKNDLRNPIAHEGWFIKNGWVWTNNKGVEKKQDLLEISKQVYDLFYFRVALTTYLMNQFPNIIKNKDITPEQITRFIEGIKNKLKELENGN